MVLKGLCVVINAVIDLEVNGKSIHRRRVQAASMLH